MSALARSENKVNACRIGQDVQIGWYDLKKGSWLFAFAVPFSAVVIIIQERSSTMVSNGVNTPFLGAV